MCYHGHADPVHLPTSSILLHTHSPAQLVDPAAVSLLAEHDFIECVALPGT